MIDVSRDASTKRPVTFRHPAVTATLLAIIAIALTFQQIKAELPLSLLWRAIWSPDDGDLRQLIVHFSLLPRLSIAIFGGAALGLSGSLMQHVLRNPLAEPATLGLSAGAYLALTVVSLWMPTFFVGWREGIALLGAAASALIVFGFTWRRDLSPLSLILAGLVVALYASAMATALLLLHDRRFDAMSIWGSGSLIQKDWSATIHLLPLLAIAIIFLRFQVKPLGILGLGDEAARALGLPVARTRFLALGLATLLTASLVSTVGVIGFVGLAAPLLARMSGARLLPQRLLWSPIIGALLLWLTDQIVVAGVAIWGDLPTGAVTALLGAPFLFLASRRLRSTPSETEIGQSAPFAPSRPWFPIGLCMVLLSLCLCIAIDFGRGSHGWYWAGPDELLKLLTWRVPRIFGACAAGAMLSMAGTMLQRLTGNAMASPELLGISAGASFALILVVFFNIGAGPVVLATGAAIGASAVSTLLIGMGWRHQFDPERLTLWGVALGALLSALMAALLASGDPRSRELLNWMSGSTYQITSSEAGLALVSTVVLLWLSPLIGRWLEILPLGDPVAQSLGLNLKISRLSILVFISAATAIATVIVGPLSFVGLMGPHLARLVGFRRPLIEVIGSALIGSLLMVSADWLGRNILFPYQVPAGLVATLIGGPYLIWLITSNGRSR